MARTASRRGYEAGRVSPFALFGVAAFALIGVGFYFAAESVGTVGSNFMDALARGDAAKLTELSYMDKLSKPEIRKKWDFTVTKAAPYYRFAWRVASANATAENTAYVRLQVQRNVDGGGAYDEKFELPLVKTPEGWKVDVRAISRDLYPGLPR